MKRLGGVFDRLCSESNLLEAWRDFRRGKAHRPSVRAFERSVHSELGLVREELRSGLYAPGPYRRLRIEEPKRRLIAAAPVRDRVVHHACYRVLAPALDRGLMDHTYACLEGRGTQRAVLAFVAALRRHRWVLALDIRHYFLSIDRAKLMALMARRIKDRRVLALLASIAQSGEGLYRDPSIAAWLGLPAGFPAEGCGLPIGNLTSQWWGNHYLSAADHFLKREQKLPHVQRYMDDLSLFSDSRAQLVEAREALKRWLWEERGLRLKHPERPPQRTEGRFTYLGYRVSRAGAHPTRAALNKMQARIRSLVLEGDEDRVRRSVASYRGLWRFVDTTG